MKKTIKIKLTENEQSILKDAIKIARKKFSSFQNGPKKKPNKTYGWTSISRNKKKNLF